METTINTNKTIFEIVDIEILNNLVDEHLKKSVYEIDYKEISLDKDGNIVLKVTYEED